MWCPPEGRDKGLDAYCDTITSLVNGHIPPPIKKLHLNKACRKALSELRQLVQHRKIRITKADKGGATVVQDCADYEAEAMKQLNNICHYQRLTADPTVAIARESNTIVGQLWDKKLIDENCHRWALLDSEKTRTIIFYHLPKVHKDQQKPPGKPIVSGSGGPTEKLSQLVDFWLQPLVQDLPSFVKDTTKFLQLVEEWKNSLGLLPSDALIVTIDVVGLYSNIPHHEVTTSVTETLATKTHLVPNAPPKKLLLKIINHILHNNIFQFDGNIFKQIFGTAMGTPMAPTIANIFMGWHEEKMLETCPWTIDPAIWKRYIDDIITIWLYGEDELNKFMTWMNNQHPSIKFTYSYGRTNVPYLDVSLSIDPDGHLTSDLHVKPTNAAMILPFNSCHPRHCPRSIPYSQCLRLRRICSEDSVFEKRCQELKVKLQRRGYPGSLIDAAMRKVSDQPRASTLQHSRRNQQSKADRVPFIVRHNPSNPSLSLWLKQFLPVLHTNLTNARMRKAAPVPPIVGERNCFSLRNLLMPSALPPLPDPQTGSQQGVPSL
ncbi:hypothetical protein ACOMHN_029084 [Nucella lapillus]